MTPDAASMPEHYAAGFLRTELSGAEQRRHCVSVTRIRRKKIAAINETLGQCSTAHPVFYKDEVDIHLNPKIDADWQLGGQQKLVSDQCAAECYINPVIIP